MELTLLTARLLLAAIFLLAGCAKLGDPKGSIQALTNFGLPRVLAGSLTLLLSAAEIAIAVALIPVAFAWYGACASLGLLTIFLAGIGVNLARGRKPDCHCFGQLHSAPVGWSTLVRNGLLAAVAGWLVSRGPLRVGPSLWQHLASAGNDERKIFIFAGCAVCFLLLRALRQSQPAEPESVTLDSQRADDSWDFEESPRPSVQNRARPAPHSYVPRAIAPLSIGTPAPEFALPSVAGQTRSLQSLLEQGKPILLVFSSPYCDPCRALQPMVRGWMQKYEESLNIVLVSRGTIQDNLAKQPNMEVSRVLLQRDFEVSEAYGCTATPAAVLVGTNGLIQSDLMVGREAIGELISSAGRQSNVAARSETHGG